MSSRPLRSAQWFQTSEYYAFSRRAWLRSEGFTSAIFDEGKPVIGIANSWSELNNCNLHLKSVAEAVKRGVWLAGGVPLEFPTISLGEMFIKPTAMLLRNLMAMDVEEMIRTQPLDGGKVHQVVGGRHQEKDKERPTRPARDATCAPAEGRRAS